MFSYKAQVDDAMDEDTVSLPHQQSFSSLKTDSDYIYQVHTPSIHIPLYDSHALKSSRPRASLYSLTSAKDLKNNDSSTFGSPVKPYHSTSGIRSFGRESREKDVSKVIEYPLTKSTAIQKSVPDLRLSSPIRKAVPDTYDDPSSVSLLSTDTASNFFYKPNTIDSNINLFSQTRKSSLDNISSKTIVDHVEITAAVENLSHGYDSFSEIAQGPALENTLHFILESGTHEIETEVPKKSRLKTTDTDNLVEDGTASADLRHLTTRISTEIFKTYSNDMSPDSNVTQQLLPKTTSFTTGAHRKNKNDSRERESGGLSDYLLSITSPKFVKHKRNEAHPKLSTDSDFYTQTESL